MCGKYALVTGRTEVWDAAGVTRYHGVDMEDAYLPINDSNGRRRHQDNLCIQAPALTMYMGGSAEGWV